MLKFAENKIVQEIAELTYTMWSMGWDEKNGGNISYLVDKKELETFELNNNGRFIEVTNIPKNLIGKYLVITASGSNFRLIKNQIDKTVGLIEIKEKGYLILAGFEGENKATSEVYMHLLSHSSRLKVDPEHKVIVHNHATDILEMTFLHELDEKSFTRTLWGLITECIVVFPEGLSILPWMVCGNEKIGKATAEKLETTKIVIWAYHGILASGNSLNDAFGLIETVNKAAKIYNDTMNNRITKGITDEQLLDLCDFFDIEPNKEILSI